MKKICIIAAAALLTTGVMIAQDINGDDDNIFTIMNNSVQAGDVEFGFTPTQIIQATNATPTNIAITGPIIKNNGQNITAYDISYSKKPILELQAEQKENEIMTKPCISNESGGEFECILNTGSDIESDTTYYATIFPKSNGRIGNGSKEITFKHTDILNQQSPQNNTNTETHGSAQAICASNLSREQNNDKITMTWTANGDGKLRIEGRGSQESSFKTIGTTNISSESFSFTPSQAGSYLVKFVTLKSDNTETGKSCNQNITVKEFKVTEVKTQTGPKETLIIIGLIAVIGGYILLRRKA